MPAAEQRWTRPLDVEPGHWKKQLPGKLLRIAAKGDVAGLRAMLGANPENLNRRGSHGRTLLWKAVKAGKQDAARFLVDAGADVALTGCYNSESHVQLTPYCAAVYYRRPALAAYLKDRTQAPDIFRQAFLGDGDSVIARVEADPSMLGIEDPCDEIYFIPLVSFAVAGGHLSLTQSLLARGAEIAIYSAQLLFLAAKAGRADLIGALVNGGADTNFIETALIATKDITVCRLLLESHRSACGNAPPEALTLIPFVRADRAERPDKVAVLLDHGVPVDGRGPDGKTALHIASLSGRLKAAALLLERGSDPSIEDEDGCTPLDLAHAAGDSAMVGLLTGR